MDKKENIKLKLCKIILQLFFFFSNIAWVY